MTSTGVSQCASCQHRDERVGDGRLTCRAFPRGIPRAVLVGELDHRNPVYGDNGLRWEPALPTSVHPLSPS